MLYSQSLLALALPHALACRMPLLWIYGLLLCSLPVAAPAIALLAPLMAVRAAKAL
ncbi:hypothetical protein JCM19239_4122 [Vibrio variabilis]|uniref:Uncharacterized protein n=1 Tax=Vibrio variabilis TaxID=990271 RepID=A0ABQ0JPV5_9VIBR|nr:hypothetical protein JCM19239_4122 [Vibrio variabilis]